jgi:threonine aldolase
MEFASDNTVGADESVLAAVAEANTGAQASYGYDVWTKRAEAALSALFDREVCSFLVLTGTAANALALSSICPAYGTVLCHAEAHINTDECGAPELFTGGARLTGLWAAQGKLTAKLVDQTLDGFIRGEHESKPSALSLTQATELGTVYSLAEISDFSRLCKERGLKLHMDGARFANAVSAVGSTPAELTWKAGVDVLTFGATKNGALALEAIIFFDPALAQDFRYRRKRGGQLLSKGRFLGAQMLAYLKDGLWLKNAAHANEMARSLAAKLSHVHSIRLPLPTQANEVFAIMPRALHEAMLDNGAHYYEWPGKGPGTDEVKEQECFVRFVTSFKTSSKDVEALSALACKLVKKGRSHRGAPSNRT